jgi:hypothetical protein
VSPIPLVRPAKIEDPPEPADLQADSRAACFTSASHHLILEGTSTVLAIAINAVLPVVV